MFFGGKGMRVYMVVVNNVHHGSYALFSIGLGPSQSETASQ